MKTQSKGPFLGINNRLPDFSLHVEKTGDFVRDAVNVDLTNSGHFVRRSAPEILQAMSGAHSYFNGYMVRSSILYAVTLPEYAETLLKVLTSNDPMSYAEFNGDVYYSNGTDSGRIAANGSVYPWALPTPSSPSCTAIGGDLFKGNYQVAVSYFNEDTGEEGGVSPSSNPLLSDTGGLRVSLPASTPGATHINVYVSTVNGSIPMLQQTVTVGVASVDITSLVDGREAQQRYEKPLPAGTRIFVFNGQLCSVAGNNVYYGIPHRLGYCLMNDCTIPFPDPVKVAIGNQSGVYIATSKITHFFSGPALGAPETQVSDVLPYGAVAGTEFHSPNKAITGWFGDKGIVLASTSGEVDAVMSDNIDLDPPASGISIVFETRGYRRIVSCGWCVNLDTKASTRYVGYDFTSASKGYGTMPDGVYALEGDGLVAGWAIHLGRDDFGTEALKHLPAAYLGGTSDLPLWLKVTTPEGVNYCYEARNAGFALKMQRVDPGKGLRANWYDLMVYSEEGTDFTLATVSFAPVASNRRI